MYNNTVKAPEFYKAGIYIRLSEADQGKILRSQKVRVSLIKEIY